MKLSDLIEALSPLQVTDGAEQEIRGLFCDSRKVEPGGLFFALKGTASDGHLFIDAAVERGAAAIVLEDSAYLRTGIPCLLVNDARLAMARSAARYHGDPTSLKTLVGITGTNGKTTTSYLVEAVLASGGFPAAVLGTISYRFGDSVIEASHTTPESTELQSALKKLADAGARSFVMEVSSHALEQKRVDGCHFDVGVFTNLTRDHLDYHGTMESYLSAKLRLFSDLLRPTEGKPRRRAVVNMDDPYGEVVAANAACPVITYGVEYCGDVRAEDVSFSVSGISGRLVTPQGATSFASRLVGRFNLANILAAAGVGSALDLPLSAIKKGIESHQTVPGRLERVENDRGVTVLVDYAHTGDALENVLQTLNELKSGRIITVIGCGGDRDRGKRPLMGAIAGRLSDLAIITSDNPRTEDPLFIVAQIRDGILPVGIREYHPSEIADGFSEKGFAVIVDRREAIRRAIRLARHGDIVLLAGKGHEDYQIIGTTKHHFDDREVSAFALKELS